MKALYTQTSIICKLKKAFFEIFSAEGKHTKEHLFDILLSVLCLNGFQSINYNFEHFIGNISDNKLNSYYFTLNESRIDSSQWMKNMVRTALSLIPDKLFKQLIIGKIGIERLTNLLTVLYAFMTILPFYDDTFLSLAHNSPQQSRFVLGMTVWHELFLTAFDNSHIFSKKYIRFCLFTYISYSFFRKLGNWCIDISGTVFPILFQQKYSP